MVQNGASRPVPPEGAQSTSYEPPAEPPKPKNDSQQGATKKSSGGAKSFFYGLLGGVVSIALVLCLGTFTPLLDAFKGAVVTSSNGNVVINADTDDVTLAEAVAAKCIDSVATIYVYSNGSSNGMFGNSGSSNTPSSLGSGVIIQNDGDTCYIVTNSHVIDGASRATVTVGGNEYEASLVGQDAKTDLAVVSIKATGLVPMEWGDSADVTVGEWVMAIGTPYGYEQTVTTGIVSAMYRSDVLPDSTGGSAVYTDMIQTDAAINPGNSGGALVNAEGELIGINTYISSTSQSSAGLGFAIPSSTVKNVAEQLISGKSVSHAFLGITMAASTDPQGVAVTSVYKDTAAAAAGLRTGDVITKIDGKAITSPSEVSIAVSTKNVGDTLQITYVRNGQENTTTATLGGDDQNATEYAEGGAPAQNNSGNGGNGGGNNGFGGGNSDNGGGNGDGSEGYGFPFDLFGF